MNYFETFARDVFAVVTDTYGVDAVWHAQCGDVAGRVLFNNPTEPVKIGGSETYEYRPARATIEYYRDTFPALKESVDAGGREYISTNGEKYFIVEVTTKFDGKTYVLHLQPSDE